MTRRSLGCSVAVERIRVYVGEVEEAACQCSRSFRCCGEGGCEGEERERGEEEDGEKVHQGQASLGAEYGGGRAGKESTCGSERFERRRREKQHVRGFQTVKVRERGRLGTFRVH